MRDHLKKYLQRLVHFTSGVKSAFSQLFVQFFEFVPMLFLVFFITTPLMDFRENAFISGYEYFVSIVSHYFWNYLPTCGSCIFWNGTLNGGMPAFAELQGAVLHPLVIVTTLLWGVTNGSKIVVIISLLLSGFASWWLAKELGVGHISRIWVSLLGVVGGHIIGRLESGNVVLVLSVASAALVLPMVLRLNKRISNRRIALLAILLALLWLSGQGYIQIGVIIGWFPAFLLLLYQSGQKIQKKWIAFGKAFLLSIALSSLLILPTLHFYHNILKYSADDFKSLQPLAYIPLNLVIRDPSLFTQTYLGMDAFPYEHINYIGWVPVLFAIVSGFFVLKQENKRIFAALFLSILLPLLFTSHEVMTFLFKLIPAVHYLRAFSVATALMVPPLLGLAAWGLQKVSELDWPQIIRGRQTESRQIQSLSLKWIILVPVLLISLIGNIKFVQPYISLHTIDIPQEDLAFLQLKDKQWVSPTSADWVQALMDDSAKIVIDRPWVWKDRQRLLGYIQLLFNPDKVYNARMVSREKDFDVVKNADELYTGITSSDGTADKVIPCDAITQGGHITVTCDSPQSGILTVREYQLSGWYAWMDGKPLSLLSSDWLAVNTQPGKHVYTFIYNPWDVYAGAVLVIIGSFIALWMIFGKKNNESDIIN
jgi:hypothetical protein